MNAGQGIVVRRIISVDATGIGAGAAARRTPSSDLDAAAAAARSRAVGAVLAPFRGRAYGIAGRMHDLERTVTAAVVAAGFRHTRTLVIQLDKYRRVFNDLPYHMRAEAVAGFGRGIEAATRTGLAQMLERATGYGSGAVSIARPSVKDGLFDILARAVDESSGGLVPPTVLAVAPTVLAHHVLAIAAADADKAAKVAGFTAILKNGNLPVGIMQDGAFLVLTA